MGTIFRVVAPQDLAADLREQAIPGLTLQESDAKARTLESGIGDGTVLSVVGDVAFNLALNLVASAIWDWLSRRNKPSVDLTLQHPDGDTRVTVKRSGPADATPISVRIDVSA